MKSKLLLSLLATIAICPTVTSVASDALTLPDPGFENQLNDWESQDDHGMSVATTEAAHTGKYGLRVSDDSEDAGSAVSSRKIPITGGKTYEVQFWARNLSGSGVGVYLRFLKADGKIIAPAGEDEKSSGQTPAVDVNKNQSNWKLLAGKKTAPAEAVAMVVYIHSYAKHKVIADFDDFAVSEVEK